MKYWNIFFNLQYHFWMFSIPADVCFKTFPSGQWTNEIYEINCHNFFKNFFSSFWKKLLNIWTWLSFNVGKYPHSNRLYLELTFTTAVILVIVKQHYYIVQPFFLAVSFPYILQQCINKNERHIEQVFYFDEIFEYFNKMNFDTIRSDSKSACLY